jgi:hypothetical protein
VPLPIERRVVKRRVTDPVPPPQPVERRKAERRKAVSLTPWTLDGLAAERTRVTTRRADDVIRTFAAAKRGASDGNWATVLVTLLPTSGTVTVGTGLQLSATVRTPSGVPLTGQTVTWASSNAAVATVSADSGDETHTVTVMGVSVGTATISATSGATTTTAPVSVTVGTYPAPSRPNEPVGYTRLFEWQMDGVPATDGTLPTGQYGVLAGDGYYFDYGTDHLSIVADATAPLSPPNVLAVKYTAGLAPGYFDGRFGAWNAGATVEYTEMYEQGYFKLVGNGGTWQIPSPGFKMLGYWGTGEDPAVVGATQVYNVVSKADDINEPAGSFSTFTLSIRAQGPISWAKKANENLTKKIAVGVWHQYELRMVTNTLGVSNGVLQFWLDGTRILNHADIIYRTVANPHTFFGKGFAPIWGGSGGTPLATTQYVYFDHLYISGKV